LKTRYGNKPYDSRLTEITVHHLLRHLSGGWGNDKTDPMFTDPRRNFEELISYTLDSAALKNSPGDAYAYSNFGYCVLGRVIETVTGQPYEKYVMANILKPAGASMMRIGGNTLA